VIILSFEEHVKIEEEAIAYIKHADGRIEKIVIKSAHEDKGIIWKLAKIFGLNKEPGTVQNYGYNQMAGLLGGVTGYYSINRLGAYDGSGYNWVATTNDVTGVGSIRISNSITPWSGGKHYTALYANNALEFANFHSTIVFDIDLTGADSISWWADITYRFS
jgi:hypothetical protein